MLLELLREGCVDLVFCNEEEAQALAEVAIAVCRFTFQSSARPSCTLAQALLWTSCFHFCLDWPNLPPAGGWRIHRCTGGDHTRSSEPPAANMPGESHPDKAPFTVVMVRRHLNSWLQVSVVSLGAKGCIARSRRGEVGSCRAPAVEVVDSIGAGDLFTAGFLHAYLEGASLQVERLVSLWERRKPACFGAVACMQGLLLCAGVCRKWLCCGIGVSSNGRGRDERESVGTFEEQDRQTSLRGCS